MVSQKVKSVILFVIAFGLVVYPLLYLFEENAKSQVPAPPTNASNETGPQPIKQVKQFQGDVNGVVVSKEGLIVISAVSDYGNEEELNKTLLSFDGVESANITKTENTGQTGLYSYDIKLSVKPDLTEKVGYFVMTKLGLEPFSLAFNSIGVPAKISVPAEVTLSNSLSGAKHNITIPTEIDAAIYSYTNVNQTSSFLVRAYFEGNELASIIAFEKSRLYQPPVEKSVENTTALVLNVTSFGWAWETDYGKEANSTQLGQEFLNETGVNVTVSFSPPLPFFQVSVNNSSEFVEKLNASGVKAQSTPGGAIVWINDSLNATIGEVLKADQSAEFEIPTGALIVRSPDRYSKTTPLSPVYAAITDRFGEPFDEYSAGCFLVEKYADTICGRMGVGTKANETINVTVTVSSIFGDIQHPVLAEAF